MADQAGHSDPGSHPNAHAGETLSESHASMADHASDRHNMGDEHEGTALGPVDVTMWGAAILGIALGLVVFLALIQALS